MEKKEKIRKVFLDDLPRKEGIGALKGKTVIDWNNSVGCKVRFIYDNIEGEFEIVKFENRYLVIKYLDGKLLKIFSGSLFKCKLGKLLDKVTNNFKFEIGQVFKDDKKDLIITNREYRDGKRNTDTNYKNKWYKYTCNVCSWTEGWIIEGSLNNGIGCSCCAGRTAVLGINTIWDTDRWMCDLGVSEEDAKRYTKASDKKIEVTCPDCGVKKNMRISSIYSYRSISCICGDGISYPEKFISSVLKQLNINFQIQLNKSTFDWCDKYRYDFYLPEYNMIIETHGEQHYKNKTSFKTVLKDVERNDKLKEDLAKDNGIEYYIVLDCRESNLEWIRKSVTNSQLNEILDLSQVDWNKCEEFALKNIVKEVCNYWNNKEEWETTQTIADNNKWGITSRTGIIKHLKKGTKLGWCYYNGKEEMRKSMINCNKLKAKKIEIFKDGISLGIFDSAKELERQSEMLFGVKLKRSSISDVCRGRYKQYKGFTFKYVENNE